MYESTKTAGSMCKYKNAEPLAWQLLQWGRSRHQTVLYPPVVGEMITLSIIAISHRYLNIPPLRSVKVKSFILILERH